VIDLGPGAGHEWGQLVFEGTVAELVEADHSITGQYMRHYADAVTAVKV
jgi:excinuclease UvrABC ATPase subunit